MRSLHNLKKSFLLILIKTSNNLYSHSKIHYSSRLFLIQLIQLKLLEKKKYISVYFINESRKLLEQIWHNKKCKYRRNTLVDKDCKNTIAWEIDSQGKLCIEIDRDSDKF